MFDHQVRSGFAFLRIINSSSKDSINGAPKVSGKIRDNKAATNVVPPNIIKGNSSNVSDGR